MKSWIRKNPLKLTLLNWVLFCPLSGGNALVLLQELVFKWVVERLVGGKVLFLGGVLIFWQVIYNFSDIALSHIARLFKSEGTKLGLS